MVKKKGKALAYTFLLLPFDVIAKIMHMLCIIYEILNVLELPLLLVCSKVVSDRTLRGSSVLFNQHDCLGNHSSCVDHTHRANQKIFTFFAFITYILLA